MSENPSRHDQLRQLPSVDRVLQALGDAADLPRSLTAALVRSELAVVREETSGGSVPPDFPAALERVRRALESFARCRLQPVINGTGVMIHTNLGRSPLSVRVSERLRDIACRYNNLELDLDSGERGRRGRFVETALAVLTGAPAATVTNNCAAALILALRHVAAGDKREVVISRGQLIEIGGGFRVPEIMETSGAVLREVGTTNKVNLADYRRAIGPRTALLLRVHRSNFYMDGFTGEPETAELVALGREHGLPVIEDLGSGAIAHTDRLAPVEHEPTPQEVLAMGVDLVCFSGDKLFGGPQAGMICGRGDLVAGIKRDPMFRALRCDRLVFVALQETVLEYLRHAQGEDAALERTPLPLLEMLAVPLESLHARADTMVSALGGTPVTAAPGEGTSRCGGGTLPRSSLPSVTLDLKPQLITVAEFARRLRTHSTPVVSYIADDCVKLDLRTVFPDQDAAVIEAVKAAARSVGILPTLPG